MFNQIAEAHSFGDGGAKNLFVVGVMVQDADVQMDQVGQDEDFVWAQIFGGWGG